MDTTLTQAQADSLFQRLFLPMQIWEWAFKAYQTFAEKKLRQTEIANINGFTSGWNFTSFDLMTLVDPYLRVRIEDETPGAGQARVSLYTADGASGLVAQGSAADGNPVALAEQNSSGIAGTVDIGTVTSSETDDEHKLFIRPDYPWSLRNIFDGTEDWDSGVESVMQRAEEAFSTIRDALLSIMSEAQAFGDEVLTGFVKDRLDLFAAAAARTTLPDVDDAGNITETHIGLVVELRKWMIDNGTAQLILRRVPTAGALQSQSGNRGVATMSAVTLRPYARAGTVIFKCEDDDPPEKFTVKYVPTDVRGKSGDRSEITLTQQMTIKGTYRAPEIGLEQVSFSRAWTKITADPGDAELGAATTFSETGADRDNTDNGKVYIELTVNVSNWDVAVYKDSGKVSKVAEVLDVATGATFTAAAVNASGLTVVGDVGSGPAGALLITMDMEFFQSDSDGAEPDQLSFAISDPTEGGTSDGIIQRISGDMWGWEMNETTSGSETVVDGKIQRGRLDPDERIVS